MGDLLGVLVVGVASALLPLVNIEAYLGVRGSLASAAGWHGMWLLSLVAAIGQMIGKVAWYYLGANALSWGWLRRKVETPRAQARLERWRARTHERPLVAGALVLFSAFTGLPPFAVVAVVAGQLRMALGMFGLLGLAGRWLRFAVVLGGAHWLSGLIR